MKITTIAYWSAAAVAIVLVTAMIVIVGRQGSAALPFWQNVTIPGPLSKVHAFLEDRCESCHVSARGPGPETCVSCHAADEKLLSIRRTEFHASVGECASCHVEHGGRDQRPIKMDHAALLTMMDKVSPAPIVPATSTTPAERARLYEALSRTLHPPAEMAASSLACANCHATEDRHRGLFGTECAQCHSLEVWTIVASRHPSPRSTECAACHLAPSSHYMMHFEMMSKRIARQPNARVEQCYLCHKVDTWSNIAVGGCGGGAC